jgi:dienelactone hydrolase
MANRDEGAIDHTLSEKSSFSFGAGALNRGMHAQFLSVAVFSVGSLFCFGEPTNLPDTQPLTMDGDLSAQMVAGLDRYLTDQTKVVAGQRTRFWKRDFTSSEAYIRSIETNRAQFKEIIGLTAKRVPFTSIELVESTAYSSKVAETERYVVFAVRWPVFDGVHGEGLWLKPKSNPAGTIIALPDADQTPEMLCGLDTGMANETQFGRRLAEAGFEVFVPVLVNRSDTYSGNPALNRFTNQPHREWIYRQAYELGLHLIGYEVQKVLALVDFASARQGAAVGVAGYGEGGLIALYSAAIDTRIRAALVSGYFGPREQLWQEPIYRNVFRLLDQFGDAEIASMIAPRSLIVEYSEAPQISGPPPSRDGRSGAAPGKIWTLERYQVEEELNRARSFFPRDFKIDFELVHGSEGSPVAPGSDKALSIFSARLAGKFGGTRVQGLPKDSRAAFDPHLRQQRQVQELVDYTQAQLIATEQQRNDLFWKETANLTTEQWAERSGSFRERFWADWIGKLAPPQHEINPRSRLIYDEPKWRGYEVVLDVWPDVFAWGILLIPKDFKPGEKRPVVVCQHGLEGVPRDTIDGPGSSGYGPYKAFTARLAERGFITFAPHNPYRGRDAFRVLQRKANPLGKSLFSAILGQHEQILNWLQQLPFVDGGRIGFYGLSYGGKTAMRVPSLLERYALSICSADFNEWVRKNATVHSRYSYMFSGEYEMPEFALGEMFNYAEMAALIAPRPFMVERGHDDGVAPDEWVAYEFAKVRRFYNKLGIGERAEIEFFNGPHTINGVGTFKFLHKHLHWPEPGQN